MNKQVIYVVDDCVVSLGSSGFFPKLALGGALSCEGHFFFIDLYYLRVLCSSSISASISSPSVVLETENATESESAMTGFRSMEKLCAPMLPFSCRTMCGRLRIVGVELSPRDQRCGSPVPWLTRSLLTEFGGLRRGLLYRRVHRCCRRVRCWNSPKWLRQERTIAPTKDRQLWLQRTYRRLS